MRWAGVLRGFYRGERERVGVRAVPSSSKMLSRRLVMSISASMYKIFSYCVILRQLERS